MNHRIALGLSTLLLGACTPTLGDAVRGMGYTEVQRQTDFMKPGTIVAIRSATPFEAARVCTQSGALGSAFKPEVSNTLSSSWQRKVSSGLNVAASYKDAINAKLGYNAVKNITLQLTNTRVFETSDDAVIAAAKRGETSEECKLAIAARHDRGLPMTMISTALQADATYVIEFENGISGELRFALLQDIAPELSANLKAEGTDKITGKDIYFGIIDDRQLLTSFSKFVSGLPQLAASDAVISGQRRLISQNLIVIGTEDDSDEKTH